MVHEFVGRAAIVTGAASGIGLATASLLMERGMAVALFDRDSEALEERLAAFLQAGHTAIAVSGDVANPDDVCNLLQSATSAFGRLDVAVANAGIDTVGLVHELSDEDWARGLAVNVTGVFLLAKYSIPQIMKAGGGSFIAVASAAGLKALAGNAAYAAAKHAVVGLVKTMAIDYAAHGLRINAVCPGFVETEMVQRYLASSPRGERERRLSKIAAGRFARPEEVASAIAHLASSDASYVNGIALMVDGGAYAGYLPPAYRASP